jgi:hypothetical protein
VTSPTKSLDFSRVRGGGDADGIDTEQCPSPKFRQKASGWASIFCDECRNLRVYLGLSAAIREKAIRMAGIDRALVRVLPLRRLRCPEFVPADPHRLWKKNE